jgi:acetyl esterase/lipase
LRKLLEKDYVVASVGYRLSQHAHFPTQLEDCKAALRWLRAHAGEYHIDPAHVGAVGPSAGGHLVALLGATGTTREFDVGDYPDVSSRVQAVVDYYGPTDFSKMQAHMLPNAPFRHDAPNSAEARLVGGPVEDPANRAAVERASSLHWLTADAPPFLIFHGDLDNVVPYHQSELLYVCFITVRGAAHGWLFPTEPLGDKLTDFFDHYLKGIDNGVGKELASRGEIPAEPPPNKK